VFARLSEVVRMMAGRGDGVREACAGIAGEPEVRVGKTGVFLDELQERSIRSGSPTEERRSGGKNLSILVTTFLPTTIPCLAGVLAGRDVGGPLVMLLCLVMGGW